MEYERFTQSIEKVDNYNEQPWTLIQSYFEGQHLGRMVRHQIESYNDFVNYQIRKTINMFNPVEIRSKQDYNEEFDKYELEMIIHFENFHIYRPQAYENNGATKVLFPQEARLRNFTYESQMTLDLNIKIIRRTGHELKNVQIEHKTIPKVHIGKLPIMLKSCVCVLNQYSHIDSTLVGECKYDAGGYFIINGGERTVLAQERAAENKVYCFDTSSGNSKWCYEAEIKSVPDHKIISPKQIKIKITNKNNGFGKPLFVELPRLREPVKLFILFRALGVTSDKEICDIILLDSAHDKSMLYALRGSIVEANTVMTQEEAFDQILRKVNYTPIKMTEEEGKLKKIQFAHDVLDNDLFPHCKTKKEKLYFLGYMTHRLISCYLGKTIPDDRDSYMNKRIDLTGILLNNLFRNYFNKMVKDMQKSVEHEIMNGSWRSKNDFANIINKTNVYKIIKSSTIDNGLRTALSTGNFGIKNTNSNKVGVAQVLNRLTYISSLSHLRRINTPIDKSGKLVPPRKLHNTSWGFICPAETPEGASVGVVKNISYMAHATIPSNSNIIYDVLEDKVESLNDVATPAELFGKIKVFVNGNWLGTTDNPIQLYHYLKEKKYAGILNVYTSITFDIKKREIRICNESGRLCRPLLRVKNGKILLTNDIVNRVKSGELKWDNLLINDILDESVVEYIDADEQNYSMVAMRPRELNSLNSNGFYYRYTHCEIHPSTIFGILASCIPFPDHNQAPRNTYQCIDSNEEIMLADGKYKKLCNIQKGDTVMTFSTNGMINMANVTHYKTQYKSANLWEIETAFGDTIKATHDHVMYTNNGWKMVKDMNSDQDLVAMTTDPIIIQSTDNLKCSASLCGSGKNLDIFYDLTDSPKLCQQDKTDLSNMNLLVCTDIEKAFILSKISGRVINCASLYNINIDNYYINDDALIKVYFRTLYDANRFVNDLKLLGFNNVYDQTNVTVLNLMDAENYQDDSKVIMVELRPLLAKLIVALGNQHSNSMMYKKLGMNNPDVESLSVPLFVCRTPICIRGFLSGLHGAMAKYDCMDTIELSMEWDGTEYDPTIKLLYDVAELYKILHFNFDHYYNSRVIIKDAAKQCVGIRVSQNKIFTKYIVENIGFSYDCQFQNKFKLHHTNNDSIHMSEEVKQNILNSKSSICFMPFKKTEYENGLYVTDITVDNEDHSFILKKGLCVHNCAMGKQAIGMYATNFDRRMDKTSYVLTYPMRPMVDTRVMNMLQLNNIPSGEMLVVAIATYSGYNQEDSLIFNKGSIDRGLFSATIFHVEKDEDKKVYGDEEIHCKPDKNKTKGMKFANYDKLNSKGFIKEGTLVENKDVIIGKVIPIKENKNDHRKIIKYMDQSRLYKTTEETYVDKNYVGRNGDGYTFCKVRMRNQRKPVIGDKFSSRHGQKGTIGVILPEEDMPFAANGIKPDLILNPHAIPSRMTIGQLKETLLGKVLLELGLFGDGTSFGEMSVKEITKELLKCGYESHGNEVLMSGMTGQQLETSIFIGPVYYQRLKHMVNDKQHSRSIGPMVVLTRQPNEGRARDGGFRFGEMERDAMAAHGATSMLKDRLYHASDAYSVHVCKKCGMISAYNDGKEIHHCKTCDNRADFAKVNIPYACKLLFQELITMNVVPRMITE
jgi:DNA-directed RNA polymerase beta subunit